jgi:hypothetical protein
LPTKSISSSETFGNLDFMKRPTQAWDMKSKLPNEFEELIDIIGSMNSKSRCLFLHRLLDRITVSQFLT